MPNQKDNKKVIKCECRRLALLCGLGREKVCDECQRREYFEWNWDKEGTGSTVVFHNNDRDVIFNPGFSVGTVAVKGTQPFKGGYHYYWEIEMSTEVYGTDMMIGVGTEKTDLKKYSHNFVSLLGNDSFSWGLSYSGQKRHAGQSHPYSKPFGQNSVIGVHLDMWSGKLEFFLDRKPLGVAFDGLRDKTLYPIISSTAARSGMNLIFCRSYPSSLQLQAMLALSHHSLDTEHNASLFKVLAIPPGLKQWMKLNYWWIVACPDRERKREEELNNRNKFDKRSGVRQEESPHASQNSDDAETDSSDEEPVQGSDTASANSTVNIVGDGDEATGSPPEQCTQASSSESTNCMHILAASTRAHFLGRISPIFIGLPDGGFSVLSSLSTPSTSSASSRSINRSRSVPAQVSTSTAGHGEVVSPTKLRQPSAPTSSSEDEDDDTGDAPRSARKEPKRLRLRASIETNTDDEQLSKPGDNAPGE